MLPQPGFTVNGFAFPRGRIHPLASSVISLAIFRRSGDFSIRYREKREEGLNRGGMWPRPESTPWPRNRT